MTNNIPLRKKSWSKWDRVRTRVFKRDKYLCQHCMRKGRLKVAEEIHHIVPISDGGKDDMDNLTSLCKDCHKAVTTGNSGYGVDGIPLASDHHWNR